MSSLVTKANKNRSAASQKLRASRGKKAASKKPLRPGKITAAPKAKKTAIAKSKKAVTSAKKQSTGVSKKAMPKKQGARSLGAKLTKKAPAKQTARPAVKARTAPAKPVQPPKKTPSPGALAAVRAFEQALKVFNRHDFPAARAAFVSILEKFGDQAEIVARARTYLAICEQRLARTPAAPRNPDALYDQGVFELNRGNAQLAVELFEKALRADPRADHVLYSLAAAYARLNDAQKSIEALRRAIAIKPVHRSHARRDLDFAGLRTNETFQQLAGLGYSFNEE
jgi:tetratricopeptide (TPR) repeat protein